MGNIKILPLSERIRGAGGTSFPIALSLTAYDFLGVVGEMTGQVERYEKLYQTCIAPHDMMGKRVYELIEEAHTMEPEEQDNTLFWLMIEPFANLEQMERRQKP